MTSTSKNTSNNTAPAEDENPSSVSFNEEPAVLMIPPVDDLSDDEVETLWYTADEQEETMEEAMDVANGWNTEGDATRGLEKFHKENGKQTQKQRQKIVRAVLEEQSRLRSSGQEPRFSLLAKVAVPISADDQETAYQRGYDDELESLPRKKAPVVMNTTTTTKEQPAGKGFMSGLSRIFENARSATPPRLR